MDKTKDCKIYFSTLVKKMWKHDKEDKDEFNPFYSVIELLPFILKRKKILRYYDLKEEKYCFLETVSITPKDENTTLISGIFKSSRTNFRPNVLDKKTGLERPNPKNKDEGDVEKTHFMIKIDKIREEVYLFMEYNFHGIHTNNLINYLSHFNTIFLKEKKIPKNYSIVHFVIARNNFLTELEALKRTKIAEVFFNKKLLGTEALKFSNRFMPLKEEVKLIASATPKNDIKDFAIDVFNSFQNDKNDIFKVRIYGNDSDNNEIILDTSFMSKIEFVTVDINQDIGDINTTQLFTGLTNIANSF